MISFPGGNGASITDCIGFLLGFLGNRFPFLHLGNAGFQFDS